MTYIGYILLGALVVTIVIHIILRKRYKRPGTSAHVWRDAVLGALNAPLQGAVWIIGLSIAEEALTQGGRFPVLAETFPPIRDAVAVAVAAWFLIRLTHRAVKNLHIRATEQGKHFDETTADAIGKFVAAVTIVIAILVIIQTFGLSIASLLTFGGVLGIALGFAAQGLVANLLGGITVYVSRPFKVGDHIVLPETSLMGQAQYIGWQAGEVQHIGWRATRILDWNGKPFYVPNAKFNTQTIINHSRMSFRQISEYVYVRIEDIDRVPGIVADVNHMLEAHPEMGDYLVFKFDSYGEYNLKLYLYAYTAATVTAYTDYMRVKEDVLLKIAAIITEHGAKLAVPVSHVRLANPSALEYGRETGREKPASAGVMEGN